MAIHSSILAWKIPTTEEPGRLQSIGVSKESDTTEHTHVRVGRMVGCKDDIQDASPRNHES